ncbi:uncharacterized protein N7515_003151 [Penicillium bovifimosum]|uniref:U3 small nucleolar RNA-associated protein 10 n=1 Tax=Penicillium bovifimosum TaxID=126998 RepID=A0A9W9H497_9EURO|nr:uncharacterized protein N7515_003151 [Penicillium bovifimosum]KAJ5138303.1 hypothetical protein N7515_003151 [Penicillium bovifimosum]
MASSLAAQLSQIAAKSTHELDLKAQRVSHSQSLIFDAKVAGSQDFDAIYDICYDGFQELCSLDPRFAEFDRTIFSEQSKAEDRGQMNLQQNKELDSAIEAFLALVGGRLQLSPAVKAVDWLVRRFRIHEFNTTAVLLTFLPYHTTPLFLNLLSILPEGLPTTFKVLKPYQNGLINPPRHPLVHSAATNKAFFAELNQYVLQVCRQEAQSHALLAFWAGVVTEAVATMLDGARSGRRETEKRKHEDILLRVLPVLSAAFTMKKASELIVGSYMICVVLAQKAFLSDDVINGVMESVVGSWTEDTKTSGLICLSVLSQHKPTVTIPRKVFKGILRLKNPISQLSEIAAEYQTSNLLLGIIAGCLTDLDQQDNSRLAILASIFERKLLGEGEIGKAMSLVLEAASNTDETRGMSLDAQTQLAELVQGFNRSETLQPIFRKTLTGASFNISALEHNLQTVVEAPLVAPATEDVDMVDADEQPEVDSFTPALESLTSETLYPSSFLSQQSIVEFDNLVRVFALAVDSEERLELFTNLPILGKSQAIKSPQYLSFFIRVVAGHYPIGTKIAALNVVSSVLSSAPADFDPQTLLPFLLVSLSDPSERIRRETAGVLAVVDSLYKKNSKASDSAKPWAHDTIYGKGQHSADLAWLPAKDAQKVLERALLPGLEESILDPNHIGRTVEATLRGYVLSEASGASELKKSLRLSLFTFLCSHIVKVPVFAPKIGLLKLINSVEKVSTATLTSELLPLLEDWRRLSEKEVEEICSKERIAASETEHLIAAIVTSKDKDAIDVLLSNVSSGDALRPAFVAACFGQIKQIWPKIHEDRQLAASEKLLDISLGDSANASLPNNCRDVLRTVELSGAVLKQFVEKIPVSITDVESVGPAPKRRRTSQNNMVAMTVKDEAELSKLMDKMTFILEIVDSSSPETHPELVAGLFQTLAALHHFKSQIQSGMSYLLTLTLGSLLAIVNKSKGSAKPQFDTSVIRADLVVDCVRTTDSPQVQNGALLLVGSLSVIAPELVLHSVMPIFTFMGSTVLRKDDDYSVSVIDQTIDQVVPALIQSLRNQKRDVVSGTSELLLSFTAAFEHIPSHRRLRLFHALISKLGTQDFLFAVLAMLANRYSTDKDVLTLMTGLVSDTTPVVELTTYSKYLNLVSDSLKPKPSISQVLLGINSDDGRDPQSICVDLLRDLAHLFKHSSLKSKLETAFESDGPVADQSRACFSRVLEQVLSIGEAVQSMKPVNHACGEVLSALFSTLSLVDFLDTIEVLLQGPNDELRRKVLRLLETRLRQTAERDNLSQIRVLDFLPILVSIVESSPDMLLKHAAVSCIDRITDKYGRKDPSKVIAAARVVASESCLGQSDDRIRYMGILCLASMAEVLGQAMIPALPDTLKRSLELLDLSLTAGKENSRLHDAIFTLFSALFVHLPFMISAGHLDKILVLSFKSANADIEEASDESRQDSLRLMARKVDVAATLGAVDRNWQNAVQAGPIAVNELLEVVTVAVDKHPKSTIAKNIGVLTKILFKAFDLRREQIALGDKAIFESSALDEAEAALNDVTIKMIYKLNDSTFRPIFLQFVEWATTGVPKTDAAARISRLTTFYKFLEVFFGTLQSIVTGYSSYILENVISVLNTCGPSKAQKSLWLAALRMLRKSFEHDQDEFWQSPSHLASISGPLIAQLGHATTATTSNMVVADVVPTITELAIAADSTDNHKELNTALMKYLRPSSAPNARSAGGDSPHTRLAALKTEQALTAQLGEEWLALLPEMLPYISELMEDEDESVEREVRKWVKQIEKVLGERLDDMLT